MFCLMPGPFCARQGTFEIRNGEAFFPDKNSCGDDNNKSDDELASLPVSEILPCDCARLSHGWQIENNSSFVRGIRGSRIACYQGYGRTRTRSCRWRTATYCHSDRACGRLARNKSTRHQQPLGVATTTTTNNSSHQTKKKTSEKPSYFCSTKFATQQARPDPMVMTGLRRRRYPMGEA
jgi:hypothetical protein